MDCGIMIGLTQKRGAHKPTGQVKISKKLQKSFKKGIDKREEMWYTVKVAAIVAANMILEN